MPTENDDLVLIPTGKIRCYIHGVLRDDKPEEHVRQRVARSLVEEYGYDKLDIALEFGVKMGSGPRKRIDIAIFHHGKDHVQENVHVVVETKREDIKPSDAKEGVEQLKSYLSVCPNAKWGLWVGSELQTFEKVTDPASPAGVSYMESTDIPITGEKEPKRLAFSDLVPGSEGLRAIFHRCHNYIHVNQGLEKETAFKEFLKLIFCKVYDERESSGPLDFCISNEERRSELGQRKLRARISRLFDRVKERYSYIFPNQAEEVELNNRVLAYMVSEIQKYSFLKTDTDVKGQAYEEIVGVMSRRERGAFFTPRNVCDMAVGMVLATYSPTERLRLRVIDPACGTGGFLRSALLQLKDIVVDQEESKWGAGSQKAKDEADRRIERICSDNLFGIDFTPLLVRAAQMNLVMHGDGSTNVFHADSLVPPGEWPDEEGNKVRSFVKFGTFDVVVTNPPFGSDLSIDDPHILQQYELATFEASSPRSSMPPEQLFIERCLRLLRPGGRLAIVLPDSILSNPGLAFIRRWVLKQAWLLASVDLPTETFEPFTGTQTSILILKKKTEHEKELDKLAGTPDKSVFMAVPSRVGHNLRGNPIYVQTPEGEEVVRKVSRRVSVRNALGQVVEVIQETGERIIDDQLPAVVKAFREWLEKCED